MGLPAAKIGDKAGGDILSSRANSVNINGLPPATVGSTVLHTETHLTHLRKLSLEVRLFLVVVLDFQESPTLLLALIQFRLVRET